MTTRHIAAEHAGARDLTPQGSGGGALKRFRHRLASDGFAIDDGWRPKPGYIYTVVRAISARVNQNYDGWPSEELKKSYKTFIGKPCFVNHENHDPTKARGVIVAARYAENGMDKYIETVMEIDAGRFPKLAREIKTGGMDSVSMGAEAGFTICSYCHNKATDLHDMCSHVQLQKGKTLSRLNRKTGKKEDVLVFESCHKISFFELSYVFEPADETAVASKVVVAGKHTVANGASEYWSEYWGLHHSQDGLIDTAHTRAEAEAKLQEIADAHERGEAVDNPDFISIVPPSTNKMRSEVEKGWDPDEDPFDPRIFGASRRTAEDLAVPAPPGTPTIPQSVIDATPVIELSPATELTGHEAPGLPNGKFSAVNLSRNVPYVGHNIPVSEGNYYRSLHTDSFDSLFDKDGVMRGNGRGGTDNLSFMSGNPLEMYTNGITKSNTIIEGDSRLPISSTDKRSGYSYVPQLNRTDVDSGATPLRVWRRKAVGSEPIESVHNWEKVYDSFPSEHRQAGKHTKQGFAADIAEITKLAGLDKKSGLDWKTQGHATVSGNPRAEGQYRISRPSDGDTYQLHKHLLTGYGDDVSRDSEHLGDYGSEGEARAAAESHRSRYASVHKHAGECPPGMDCSMKNGIGLEQITKDSPNNPVNQVSYDPASLGQPGGGGTSSGYQGNGKSGRDGLNPGAQSFYDQLAKDFPGASMGGYNPVVDQPWDEHATGDAFDFMTGDIDQGNAIRDRALENGAKHVIWQQKLWYPGGGSEAMENRGSPTENHYDHVHINMGGAAPKAAPAAPTQAQPKNVAPTTRSAGKYTKDDFAIADGKKPWERDKPERAPVEEEAADLKEIEAMVIRAEHDDLPPLPGDFKVPDNLGEENNTSAVEPWMDPEEFIKYHNDYFGQESDPTTQSNIRDMSPHSLHSYWQDLENQRGKTPEQLKGERQQSKDKAKEMADNLWGALFPPEEEEGRKAVQNMDTVNNLMASGWQPEHIKYDEDDQPYAHYQHPSGWSVTDHGGMYKELGHAATPGETHDVINVSRHDRDSGESHNDLFGPSDAHNFIEEQLHGDPEETGGTLQYLTQNHPAIRKYKPRQAMTRRAESLTDPLHSQDTTRRNTINTYLASHDYLNGVGAPKGHSLDFGAGWGDSANHPDLNFRGARFHTLEPHPNKGMVPDFTAPEDIDEGTYRRVHSLNVLNVAEPAARDAAVRHIGRILAPGGHAVITTRGRREIENMLGVVDRNGRPVHSPGPGSDPGGVVVNGNSEDPKVRKRYQKGFDPDELHQYVSGILGDGYSVKRVKIGSAPAAVHIIRNADNIPAQPPRPIAVQVKSARAKRLGRRAALKKIARNSAVRLAYGETEAPMNPVFSHAASLNEYGKQTETALPIQQQAVRGGGVHRVREGAALGQTHPQGIVSGLLSEGQEKRGPGGSGPASNSPAGQETRSASDWLKAAGFVGVRGTQDWTGSRESGPEQLGLGAPMGDGADARARTAARGERPSQEPGPGGQPARKPGAMGVESMRGRSGGRPDQVRGESSPRRGASRTRLGWGEVEAPMKVDTLREEGTAPEDDNNDDQRYVDPADNDFASMIESPADLQTPDLSEAAQIDRQQEEAGGQESGIPGEAEGGPAPQEQGNFITLKIPVPPAAPQVPQQAGAPVAVPPQPMMPPQAPAGPAPAPEQPPITASLLNYFDGYYGRRVANWLDAIEAGRALNPAEAADYRRQTEKFSTLENGRDLSTTNRNPTKGTANMARTNIASRNKVATAGRRQHFAEGPLVDGGPYGTEPIQSVNEEEFITQTPPSEAVDAPTDDAINISNTEHNLVARVQQGRAQLLRDAEKLASIQRQRRAFDEAGGPVAEVVDPRVLTGPGAEALTGTDFESANPNDGVVPTQPKDASLRAFQAFDGWLSSKTGKSSRRHTEANIKKAAAAFSREAGISPQALFPALGIVLREARKNDKIAATKGAKMRKRADEKLEVAAPDGRVDVEAPVSNTTSAEAQASQFDVHDFGNNAGDNVAKPDLSTDQNWAPGEASKSASRVKTAGGLLAMRCAEGMIEAGLEPNSRERKYQLAAEFEQMNRGLIQDRVALLERFAAVRQAERRKVASGDSRGAARSPIPAGLGGGTRTAAAPQRTAAHDPSNDSTLFI